MTTVYQWRVRCSTENAWVYTWSDTAPTVCPNNAGHTLVGSPVTVDKVSDQVVTPNVFVGGPKSCPDGMAFTAAANGWTRGEYTLPHQMHLQWAYLIWKGCFIGDYGFLHVINPAGDASPTAAVTAGDTTLDVGAVAAYYDPLVGGGAFIEFWDSTETTLIEVRPIDSVSGTVVTLGEAVSDAHGTDAKLRCVVKSFGPHRGAKNIDAGLRFIGDNNQAFGVVNQITDVIPAGMVLAARIKTTADAGDREFVVNFLFREPVS